MSSNPADSIEGLQLLVGERDATIAMLKNRATIYVEKLKSEHAESLLQEQTARQQLQDKLEAAKPIFIRLKDEKTALAEQLTMLTDKLNTAETSFKTQVLEIQTKSKADLDTQKRELLALQSSALLENDLVAVNQTTNAAIEKVVKDNNGVVEKLSHQLFNEEESQKKQIQEFTALKKSHTEATAAMIQLRESNASLTSGNEELSRQLAASTAALMAAQKGVGVEVEALQAQLVVATEAAAAMAQQAKDKSTIEAQLSFVVGELAQSREQLLALQMKVQVDTEKLTAKQNGQNEKLKSDLLLSEEHLMAAEESAWKAKAEASEMLFALEQEQGNVKRMNEQIEKMRDETARLASEHAKVIQDIRQSVLQSESEAKGPVLNLPLNGTVQALNDASPEQTEPGSEQKHKQLESSQEEVTALKAQVELLEDSLSIAESTLETADTDLAAAKRDLLEVQNESLASSTKITAEAAAHYERISALEKDLFSARVKETEMGEVLKALQRSLESDLAAAKEKEGSDEIAAREGADRLKALQTGLDLEVAAKKVIDIERVALQKKLEGVEAELLAAKCAREAEVTVLEADLAAAKDALKQQEQRLLESLNVPKEADAAVAQLTAALEKAREEAGTLKALHAKRLKENENVQIAHIAELKASHAKQLSEIEKAHSAAASESSGRISRLGNELAAAVRKDEEVLTSVNEKEVERVALQKKLEGVEAELLAAKSAREAEVTVLEADLAAAKDALKQQEQRLLENLNVPKEADAAVAQLTAALEKAREEAGTLKALHAKRLKENENVQIAHIAELKASHAKQLSEIEKAHSAAASESSGRISRLGNELAAAVRKDEEVLTSVNEKEVERVALQKKLEGVEAELLAAKSAREAEVTVLEADLAAAKDALKQQEQRLLENLNVPKEADAAVAQLTAALEKAREEAGTLKALHAKRMKENENVQIAHIAELKASHAKQLSEIEKAHSAAASESSGRISRLGNELAAAVRKDEEVLTSVNEKEVERVALQKKLEGVEAELLAAKSAREAEVTVLKADLAAAKEQEVLLVEQLKGLREQSQQQAQTTQQVGSAAADSLAAAVADLAAKHSTAMAAQEEMSNKLLQEKMDTAKALFTQLKESMAAMTAKEEQLNGKVNSLTARCAELDRVEAEKAAGEEKVKELTAHIALLAAEHEERVLHLQKDLAASVALAESLKQQNVEQQRAQGEAGIEQADLLNEAHVAAVASLQQQLSDARKDVTELSAELSHLNAELASSSSALHEMKASSTEAESAARALETDLCASRDRVGALQRDLLASEKALSESKDTAAKKISSLSAEVQKIETALGSKKSELDGAKANLAATTTAYSALSAQHNQLKAKADQLTQQLEAEVFQTQERKQKVRAYVDNLNTEKRDMEVAKQGILEQLGAAGSRIHALEAQVAAEESKLKREEAHFNTARQAALLELEQQQQEYIARMEQQDAAMVLQKQETSRLQGLLDEHARATAEEVQEAYRQMALSGKELESHKAKRLVARNEMIGAAQALERSQSEGQALRAYIQYKLAPIVFEQVAALEMLLSAVEHFRSQLSSKGNVRLHNTASEFLARRLIQSGQPHSPSSTNYSPESSESSTNSNSILTLRSSNLKGGEETDLKGVFLAEGNKNSRQETGVVRANSPQGPALGPLTRTGPISPFSSGSGGGGQASVSILGEAMEQAEVLRKELNRVHAGLSLLSHSVDRLGDIVAVDSRCCGGVFQMISDSMTGTIEGSIRGSLAGRTLVSHNNTSGSSGRDHSRPAIGGGKGLGGMISSGLGYTTVMGDEGPPSGSGSSHYGGRRTASPPREGGLNPMLKDLGQKKDLVFSILPHEDDDEGEELEIV